MMNAINVDLVVTIVVVTYNSSQYVLETLESIKAQTYPHLALVISDDCSTDKTVKLCKEWVKENKQRFVSTKVLESPVNTGVSANGNRAEAACETKWVKGIAGDDILLPNCIQDNMDYVAEHPDTVYLFSKINVFGPNKRQNHLFENIFDYSFFQLTPEQQYERLIFKGNCIPASTCFSNREKTKELGVKNDERIPMLNDHPKWLNALKKGIFFHFMVKVTVLYRVHGASLSTSRVQSPKYYKSCRLFYYYYLRDEYIRRYGLEKVVEDDVLLQLDSYKQLLTYRSLLLFRVAFFLKRIINRLF